MRGENTSSDLMLEEERGRFEETAGLGIDIARSLVLLFVFIVCLFGFNGGRGVNSNDTEGQGAQWVEENCCDGWVGECG